MKRVRRSITAQVTLIFALVSAVVVAAFAVMSLTASHLQSTDHQRAGSTRALVAANQLEQAVLDLETGLRGYLLAGQPAFLQPYQEAVGRYPELALGLQAATAGDEQGHRLSLAISAAVKDYVSRWAAPVIRTAQTDLAAARRREAGGAGKARVDAMRAQFAALLDHETTIHIEQVNRASDLATLVLVLGIGATVLFLGLIVLSALRTQRGLVAPLRRLATAVAAITAGDLSARVPAGGAAEVGAVVDGFNRMAESLSQQREALEEVGGYATDTVGEDMELVVRLHRHFRARGIPYRIEFVADPVCWTEVPEDLGSLSRQRRRWHRGLGQTLWRHRDATFNPRYGAFGLIAMPYFLLLEFLGPVVETVGTALTIVAFLVGDLSGASFVAFLVLAFLVAILLSIAALALEEFNFRRHQRTRDIVSLVAYTLLENLGYRQLNDMWRVIAFWDLARRKQGWGAQKRRGIGNLSAAETQGHHALTSREP